MRIELTQDELQIAILAIESMTIKGKDAPPVAKMLTKLYKSFEKSATKE